MKSANKIVCLLLSVGLLCGCRSTGLGLTGKTVPPEKRIPLVKGGIQTDLWTTRDLSLNFSYEVVRNQWRIKGTIDYAGSLKNNYIILDYFHMDVLFVDAQGKILSMNGLMSTGSTYIEYPESFEISIPLPPGAEAMAFSYRGQTVDTNSGKDGGLGAYFWEYPVQ